MSNYLDIFHLMFYAFLALIFVFFYYRYSKHHRLKTLKKHGFLVSTESNETLKRRLRKLAPIHMLNPELPSEIIASYKGVLVFWCATYKTNRGNITCWCFRKCESNKSEPEEIWWQAIHVSGLNEEESNHLIRHANRQINGLVDLTNNENGVLMVYERSLFSFSNTLSVVMMAIDCLNKPRS